MTEQGQKRIISKNFLVLTSIGEGRMSTRRHSSFYQEFALGLFIKALTKLDCKYKAKLPRKHLNISPNQQSLVTIFTYIFAPV